MAHRFQRQGGEIGDHEAEKEHERCRPDKEAPDRQAIQHQRHKADRGHDKMAGHRGLDQIAHAKTCHQSAIGEIAGQCQDGGPSEPIGKALFGLKTHGIDRLNGRDQNIQTSKCQRQNGDRKPKDTIVETFPNSRTQCTDA